MWDLMRKRFPGPQGLHGFHQSMLHRLRTDAVDMIGSPLSGTTPQEESMLNLQLHKILPTFRYFEFDRGKFFEQCCQPDIFGPHGTEKMRKGLKTLLDFIQQDSELTNIRWIAYMLATAKHETGGECQPVEEVGKGKGKEYGKELKVKDSQGREYVNVYYGRGYVQLTWKDNYVRLSKALGLGDELVIHPERALEPDIAYRIMSVGMREGLFTGRKLSDYISRSNSDYYNARRIINVLDKADIIKKYAEGFEKSLFVASKQYSEIYWSPATVFPSGYTMFG